ncbi:SH3 domain-containing protein [Chamaesiphon sp. OTE_20_metabat_361]|uniref:SH3 domain-containing protein n=1 Tax=Chamaesiphon sp. OTE_20_metabat_361 TaxID=2964689 RepID=UPI00286CA7A6|nr:SH3 domain-containing protein [Chamaesiphon sp. OTE_20_metabat_361]
MKILTATALLFAIALPASAQVGPAYSNRVTKNLTYGNVCTAQGSSSLSIRSGPGKSYRVLKQVSNGTGLSFNGSQYGKDGFQWLRTSSNGRRGWVRSDYICEPECAG